MHVANLYLPTMCNVLKEMECLHAWVMVGGMMFIDFLWKLRWQWSQVDVCTPFFSVKIAMPKHETLWHVLLVLVIIIYPYPFLGGWPSADFWKGTKAVQRSDKKLCSNSTCLWRSRLECSGCLYAYPPYGTLTLQKLHTHWKVILFVCSSTCFISWYYWFLVDFHNMPS